MSNEPRGARRKLIDFQAARAVYRRGENVTEHLRAQLGVDSNTPEIIETAYDLQAGTYIAETQRHLAFSKAYTSEIAEMLSPHLRDGDSILDIGCGELTTLSLVAGKLTIHPSALYAFDISWSRIKVGLDFAATTLAAPLFAKLIPFTADIGEIPLRSKSIDVVTTSHALEPNGGRETELLREILRVSRRAAVLFEPSYELNSDEGRIRMDRLGYVRNIEGAAKQLGAKIVAVRRLANTINTLNPTTAYVIQPGEAASIARPRGEIFSDPGTDNPLNKRDGFYFSAGSALSYPIIDRIPVLRSSAAILTSALGASD